MIDDYTRDQLKTLKVWTRLECICKWIDATEHIRWYGADLTDWYDAYNFLAPRLKRAIRRGTADSFLWRLSGSFVED